MALRSASEFPPPGARGPGDTIQRMARGAGVGPNRSRGVLQGPERPFAAWLIAELKRELVRNWRADWADEARGPKLRLHALNAKLGAVIANWRTR